MLVLWEKDAEFGYYCWLIDISPNKNIIKVFFLTSLSKDEYGTMFENILFGK